jgi:enamine deaminase RidA (YjgF/YER057c/UK114 family)
MGNNWTNPIQGGIIPKNVDEYNYGQGENPDYAQTEVRNYIIGLAGVAGCNFNFANPANALDQILDLGADLKAECKLISALLTCVASVAGFVDMQQGLDTISGGNRIITQLSCDNITDSLSSNPIPAAINFHIPNHLYLLGTTQGLNNWNAGSLGKWILKITYKDYSK